MAKSKACPNPKSKEWRNITKRVGVFEAYRIFIRNGYDVPTFVFKDIKDVYKYLDFHSNNTNILSKKNGTYYIPYGKDISTWYTNSNLVKNEVERINKIYEGLLSIKSKPITTPDTRTPGRTKIEWVEVVEHALTQHYDIYNQYKEKQEKDANEHIIPIETYEQRIDYTLRLTAALQKLQRNIFKQNKLQGWINDLQKQGVPKEQIEFFKESAKDGMTKDEIIASIAANYTYSVESKTAIQKKYREDEKIILNNTPTFTYNGERYYVETFGEEEPFGGIDLYYKDGNEINEEEYKKALDNYTTEQNISTKYYSNLTVPGGTNYTENEISTPLITPSIKGHAQFSTDQGIGWFRSDEATTITKEDRQKQFEALEAGIDYNIIQTQATGKTKTRRILEIQSDLFQKGRNSLQLTNEVKLPFVFEKGDFEYARDEEDRNRNIKRNKITGEILYINDAEYQEEYGNLQITPRNKFLQLLNKDNNWVTFFIKSIIQDSAKKGYEKVLFPKGETAAKVEGHETIADELKEIDFKIDELERKGRGEGVRIGDEFVDVVYKLINNEWFQYVDGEKGAKAKPYRLIELEERKSELKTQGIEKLKPIEAFYEIKVGNILKKLDHNIRTITDEYGNQWYEYTIKSEDFNKLIELQRNQTVDRLSSENREDFEKKKTIMLKTFPRIKEVIEDYSTPQAGLLEANGTIIRVNPKYYTEDTIGHEFGHLLIDLIGGTSNPLIKKGIEQLKDTELWNEVLSRYEDIYETNKDKFYKEVLATAIGEDTAKIFNKQKQLSDFQKWLDRLWARIKQVLGIERSVAKKLARIVLSGQEINIDGLVGTYESRVSDSVKERLGFTSKKKTKISDLREQIIDVLSKKYSKYQKYNFINKQDFIERTLKQIEELDNDPIEAIKLFQDFAISETDRIYKDFRQQERKKRNEEKPFSLRELRKWYEYVSGFELLGELIRVAKDYNSDLDESIIKIDELNKVLNRKETITKAYLEEGAKLVAEKLSKYSSHIEVIFREEYEREYNKLSKEEKSNISKDEYIKAGILTDQADIREQTKKLISGELRKATKDINFATRWMDNVLDSPDIIVSSMAKMFASAEFESRQTYIEIQNNLVDIVRELEAFYDTKNIMPNDPLKMYSFMLEKDKEGNYTQNIVDIYRSSLWESYEIISKELEAEGLPYDEIKVRQNAWKKVNMPIDSTAFNAAKDTFYRELLKSGLISKEELRLLEENDSMEAWLNDTKKDPSEFLQSDTAAEMISEFHRDNLWKYRTPINFWRNPQWLELVKMAGGDINKSVAEQRKAVEDNKSNDPRINFYNFIIKNRDEIQKGTPYGHRLHTRLPSVLKDTNERLISKSNTILDSLMHTVNSSLNVLADESERGERILTDETGKPIHFIPIYYTSNIRKIYGLAYDKLSEEEKNKISREDYINKKAHENQSYDLASIYIRYFNSAIDYKAKFKILPEMEMARELVNKRKVIQRDGKGNAIMQAISKGRSKVLDEPEETSNIAAQLNDWFEAVIYGVKEKDEGTFLGGRIDVGKTANLLNKYTAFSLLGLNFIAGTANVTLAGTMQWIESFGKDNYSPKDYAKAKYVYNKNLPGILGDIGSRKPRNFISLLLQKFDILNEYDIPEFRKNSKFKNLMSFNSMFFTMNAGEHMMQTKVLLAMLNRLDAKDEHGKIIGKMLDFISVKDGKLDISKEVKNFGIEEQTNFVNKVRRVLSSMHGEYSNAGRVALQRYALGRMAYMFRKFIVPGLKRRWGKKNINNLLEENTEGYYRTSLKFFRTLMKDLSKFQFALISEDWNGLLDKEKANIRKALVEMTFLMMAIMLSSALVKMKEDDEGDEDWYLSFLTYQAFRLKTELWFFSNPMEAMKILRSPAASMSVIENIIKLIGQLMPPEFVGFDRYERGNWKGRPKIEKTLINFVPGMKQVYRLKYVDDQINWLKN